MAGGKSGGSEGTDGLFAIELASERGSGQLISAGSSVIVFLILLSWSAFAKLCVRVLKSQHRGNCQFLPSSEMNRPKYR